MPRPPTLLHLGLLVFLAEGCIVLDAPLLRLRTVAGGIHNRRRGVGIAPFFLPDGRMGCAANGALFLEDRPGGTLVEILPHHYEVDDPCASPDGRTVLFVAGREQITAGGGHNDHVFQVYAVDLEGGDPEDGNWSRITHSRRAEVLPRFLPGGGEFVFVRRVHYTPYALYQSPWSDGAVFVADADGERERQLTPPLFHPFRGLVVVEDGAAVIFGAEVEEGLYALHRLALEQGATPTRLVEDALLPASVPETEDLVYVRGRHGDASLGEDRLGDTAYTSFELLASGPGGADPRPLVRNRGEILAVAVSPDGERVVFTEVAPEEGQFGAYVLWEVPLAGGEPRRLESIPHRSKSRFKPGDLVQPVSWWGRTSRFSPGSR